MEKNKEAETEIVRLTKSALKPSPLMEALKKRQPEKLNPYPVYTKIEPIGGKR